METQRWVTMQAKTDRMSHRIAGVISWFKPSVGTTQVPYNLETMGLLRLFVVIGRIFVKGSRRAASLYIPEEQEKFPETTIVIYN